jgi:serine/threonine protein phosphatase 1
MKATATKTSVEREGPRQRFLRAFGLGHRAPAAVPDGMRVYAVGDIHGRADLLDKLHETIDADARHFPGRKEIVYLGDFIDRGRDSKGVVDRVLNAVPFGLTPRYIRGNHDQALLDFLDQPETYRAWRNYGAGETLLSYGVKPPLYDSLEHFSAASQELKAALPRGHLAFFRGLEFKTVVGDYVFVHAGLRPGVPLERQSEQDLMWIRDEFLSATGSFGKVVVHGHTPVEAPVKAQNRISIDTGAYATGVLTSSVLEGATCRFLQARLKR